VQAHSALYVRSLAAKRYGSVHHLLHATVSHTPLE
jgi:hypothetical protein